MPPRLNIPYHRYCFALKGMEFALSIKGGRYPETKEAGAYGTTVGIISLGMIGRRVCRRLKFDLNIIAYDPYVSPEEAELRKCILDEIFKLAVWFPCTLLAQRNRGMITGKHGARSPIIIHKYRTWSNCEGERR